MNKNLSPKALSKEKHKATAWLSVDVSKKLNQMHQKAKLENRAMTKSLIISVAVTNLYFSEPDYDFLLNVKDQKINRTTFYLDQQTVQHLWDIESHWLGEGKKVNISAIVNAALINMDYDLLICCS